MSKYPQDFDAFELKRNAETHDDPNGDFVMAEDINELQDSILAIQQTIGKNPQGRQSTVANRLDKLGDISLLSVPSLLYYLGNPLSINGASTIEESVLEYLQHEHVIFGKEVLTSHESIIARTKHSKNVKFYGYIDVGITTNNLSIQEIQAQIVQWNRIGVDGIFCANMGYDKGVTRARQNTILDSIHEHGLVAFMESTNPNDVLSDTFHETANPDWALSKVMLDDIYLHTSFAVEQTNYADPFTLKGIMEDLQEYRETLDIQVFGIAFPNTKQQYRYAHGMALLWSLDGFGVSRIGYGENDNASPHFDWAPLVGQWYSKEITIDEVDGVFSRTTGFGSISVDTNEHTVSMKGIQIPFELLELPEGGIDGGLLRDASISSDKIGSLDGAKLISDINASTTNQISLSRIEPITLNTLSGQISTDRIVGDIDAGRLNGAISADLLVTNVIGAINAYIGEAQINMAKIVDLDAEKIKTGTLEAARISASVVAALELYAAEMEVGSATINNAVIGQLDVENMSANIIEAINLEAQTAQINQARIEDLHASKITAGDIEAERLRANTITAINAYADTITAEDAKIKSAAIGRLTADHITASVVEAINIYAQNLGTEAIPINKAVIQKLDAEDISTIVFEAIEANIYNAKINSAYISDLTADHILGIVIEAINLRADDAVIHSGRIQELTADHIKGSVIDAINLNANLATIDSAVIPALTSEHITASVIEAINANIEDLEVGDAKIKAAMIDSLKAENIQAEVIKAINASIENATIDAARIGVLKAENIQAEVIQAINLSVEQAKIKSGQIENLDASKIVAGDIETELLLANVVKAINSELQTAVIQSAKIEDLNASKIVAGDIDAERIQTNVISAINANINMIEGDFARIDSAAIGVLAAEHMQAKVISAVNASVEQIDGKFALIDSAKIGTLTADHIEAAVIEALEANIGKATINQALIGELSADKITTGNLSADVMMTNVISAINGDFDNVTIQAARIGILEADNMQANVISAINGNFNNITIDKGRIGQLDADNIEAGAITTEKLAADSITADKIATNEITAKHLATDSVTAHAIEANAIIADKIAAEAITAGKIKAGEIKTEHIVTTGLDAAVITFGTMSGDRIQANTITADHIEGDTATIGRIISGHIQASDILAGQITGDHIKSLSIETKHFTAEGISGSIIKGDSIHGSKIIAGTLSASNLQAGSITSVEIAAQTIQTRNLASGAVDASVLRAGTITAEHISTIGLDANLIEVFGTNGQTLIGDGYLKVDGLDVGVVQSDNLVGNGLFLSGSSSYGHLRDNPSGEAVLGNQSIIPGSHQVWRFNITTGDRIEIDLGGSKPVAIDLDTENKYAYVTLQGENKIVQLYIDEGRAASRTGKELPVGVGPAKMYFTGDKLGDHKHFFVLNTDPKDVNIPDSLTIFDAPPNSINGDLYVHHMIPLGNTPWDMVLRTEQAEGENTDGGNDHGMHTMSTDDREVGEHQHAGHAMTTYVTLAGSGDIAVIDMTSPESMTWTVNRTIPITAFATDNYHGGLDGRFGLGVSTGGDSSAPFSDLAAASMVGHAHAAGGYATSDGTMRTYSPHGIALSKDFDHLYVTDYSNGHLVIVDAEGKAPYNSLSGTRQPGIRGEHSEGGEVHPHAIAEDAVFSIQAGGHNHGNFGDGPIRVPGFEGIIPQEEQTTRWVRYRIPVGTSPESVQIVHGKIFITNEGSSTISVLDEQQILDEIAADREFYKTWNNQKEMRPIPMWNIREIHVGSRPTEMRVDPTGAFLYITINGQNQIVKIDVETEEIVQRFPTGPNPKGIAISPDGVYLYVVNHGGSGNLSFVYPEGSYIGDAYLGLEGGVEFHGAEHWVPNRSDWIYELSDGSTTTSGIAGGQVRSASTVEFRINEPFLNEGGYARLNLFGVDNQWATIEQDIFNVTNYSNGSNVAIARAETLKQDATLIRYWPKNEWLREYEIRNITVFAKNDEILERVEDDARTFRPSKNWIDKPERPVILMGLPGSYAEVSENNYSITYGSDPKIVFHDAVPYDMDVYCTSYYYSEQPTPDKYTIYYEDDTEASTSGMTYAGSHIKFVENYLPKQNWVEADYTFRHNRWFRNHNGSVQIATENSSSENFYVQFEVDEFVPKFVTVDNTQTEPFEYWPIEVPERTSKDYTGLVYSNMTNRAIGTTVIPSAIPISGSLASIVDGAEPMSEGGEDDMHMHAMEAPIFKPMHSFGETVVFPGGLQHVVVDLGATFMIGDIHITHAFHENRIYHETKTEVSEDNIHWYTIYDSAASGEYNECRYNETTGATHYGMHHKFHARPVRYIRDWANGYTEYQKNGTDVAHWNEDTVVGEFEANHWTEIQALGDWEFESEFARNYTDELLNKDVKRASESFVRGGITSSGPIEIGTSNERDITRIVNKNLLFSNNYTPSGVLQNGSWTYPAETASITIDLGSIQQVDTVRIWRYYADGRTHHNVKTEISTDGSVWTTIYDSQVQGEYGETPGGRILSLGGVQSVRYIRDSAKGWTALLKSGTTLTGNDVRWVGAHAYIGYNPGYPYTYQSGSELEGQNLATNGRGVVTSMVPKARIEMDIKIDFTSWWYMTYIVGPEFGQLDVQMPTVMGGSHSMFQDSPYLNKIAHRHIMSWPTSVNIKEDEASGTKAGHHKMVLEHISGKVSLDRLRFEDYQYLYKNSTEIPKGNATNFVRYKIEPDVGRWYVGRGNQSTEGAYDAVRTNPDTGRPDGSASLKYRFRVRTSLQPQTMREERGIAYVTSAIFETGRLSSHWRMSEGQDSFPGNRIEVWDPNQPHKTGIQGHHLANGAIQGNKIMPLTVMNHHISNYARITESKLNLNHPTHRHGHLMTMADGTKMWMDNKPIIDSIHGWGESGTKNVMAREDHDHDGRYIEISENISLDNLTVAGDLNFSDGVTLNAETVLGLETNILNHIENVSVHITPEMRTKLVGIEAGANKYTHPATHSVDMITETATQKIMTADERTKLVGIQEGANNYVHPSTHSLDMITETTNKKIMTDAERTKLTGIEEAANNYIHPTSAGNKHIPTGGATGQILRYSASGTAAWGTVAWNEVTSKPLTFTPAAHTHTVADIGDLNAVLSNYITHEDLTSTGEVRLAETNVFTGQNIFTKADGPAIIIKPSTQPAANTILFQMANTAGQNMITFDAEGDVVISANLTVQGTTTYSGTNTVDGDYDITGNLTVGGNVTLGDGLTDQATVKGDLVVEGLIKPKGKAVEVARFPVFGMGGDLQFQSDSTVFETIIHHYSTFANGTNYPIPSIPTGAERKYRLLVAYATVGEASAAQLKVIQYGGTTSVTQFELPAVNGVATGMVRHLLSPEFKTTYAGHTSFQALSAGAGKDLVIKYIEVIAYDYFA